MPDNRPFKVFLAVLAATVGLFVVLKCLPRRGDAHGLAYLDGNPATPRPSAPAVRLTPPFGRVRRTGRPHRRPRRGTPRPRRRLPRRPTRRSGTRRPAAGCRRSARPPQGGQPPAARRLGRGRFHRHALGDRRRPLPARPPGRRIDFHSQAPPTRPAVVAAVARFSRRTRPRPGGGLRLVFVVAPRQAGRPPTLRGRVRLVPRRVDAPTRQGLAVSREGGGGPRTLDRLRPPTGALNGGPDADEG